MPTVAERYSYVDDSPAAAAPVARRAVPLRVPLSEVIAALSHALDLTEGQPLGHTMRSCLIGMRIAQELSLSAEDRSALYYALLLKDAGCSSNAARIASLFGSDDRLIKPRLKLTDLHHRLTVAVGTMRNVGIGQPLTERLRHFLAVTRTEGIERELIAVRCERGAGIARRIGFPQATADAIFSLDEHWCGLGYPDRLAGENIPLLSRIANLAQTVEVFHDSHGIDAALRVAKQRRGSWFDPELVDIVCGWEDDAAWWRSLRSMDVRQLVVEAEPVECVRFVDEEGLDEIALAFADIIDAKSPYTYGHSWRVAQYARTIACDLGIDARELARIHRAGLLHDIGKLGVSSQILDKPGKLTREEFLQVQQHPKHTLAILSQVSVFGQFAWTASLHHEKLDGSGYPWSLKADQLDQASRILTVADIYDALTTDRPYRAGMSHEQAMDILVAERSTKLCDRSVDAADVLVRIM